MEPIDLVLEKLNGIVPHNSYWMAQCPAHPDNNPSMEISETEEGTVLLHCFAGCTVDEIVAAMGLQMRDLFVQHVIGNELHASTGK